MYHWYSSFPITLGGCPNFDPMHGKKWKEKRNSTYYLLLMSVCMEEQDAQEIMVYLSSTHLSHFNAFCSLLAQWSWDEIWYSFESTEKSPSWEVPIFTFVGSASDEWLWWRRNHNCSTLKASSLCAMDGRHGSLLMTCMSLSCFFFAVLNPLAFSFVGWSRFCWGVLFPYWVHEELDLV